MVDEETAPMSLEEAAQITEPPEGGAGLSAETTQQKRLMTNRMLSVTRLS